MTTTSKTYIPNTVILITGDRNWTDYDYIYNVLSSYTQPVLVIHGGCRGADLLSDKAAKKLGFNVESRLANWSKYGYKPGPIRNIEMIELSSSYIGKAQTVQVIAFHDNIENSKGTKHCMEKAKQYGLAVIHYSHNK